MSLAKRQAQDVVPCELPDVSDDLVRTLESPKTPLSMLLNEFSDPGDAYIVSPTRISIRRLSRLYEPTVPEEDRPLLLQAFASRCRDERWVERRAIFQARRASARRETILEAESTVWAMMGLDFHARRMRSAYSRWELLADSVEERLEVVASGVRGFDSTLRDACRELRELERELTDLMPGLGLKDRASAAWEGKANTRERLLEQVEERLDSIAGAGGAAKVFVLLEQDDADETEGADGES